MTAYAFKLPDLGEGTVEAELLSWHVKAGDEVGQDQIIAEVMTEKAAVELPSPVSGRVVRLAGSPGELIKVGAVLIEFELADPAEPASPVNANGIEREPARIKASPATRRRAHEAGVSLDRVQGSGPGGRITAQDVAAAATLPAQPRSVATEDVPLMGLRRVIAERMSEAKRTIPHFGYVEELDVTELESLRAHLNDRLPQGAPSLTYLPFIITALARALRRFPQCNAVFDAQRNVVVRHRAVHVGVATQTRDGLVVPVIRNAEALSVNELAERLRSLAERARARRCSKEELTGSTITVSSLGKLGGVASTPVINLPEVAIVGVNKVVEVVRPVNGAFVVRRVMNLSCAFDHRFVDGYDAAAMIQEVKGMIEHPATLFMR